MFNVYPACGEYSVDKQIDPRGPYAICPHCGYAHPFRRRPLFIVTGASGTGKTATCLALVAADPPCVVLETDILWRPVFDTPADGYRTFRGLWLRLAKDIGQSGPPVALFGTALPEQIEPLPERRYFSAVYYLALVCDDDILVERLRSRPAWRGTDTALLLNPLAFRFKVAQPPRVAWHRHPGLPGGHAPLEPVVARGRHGRCGYDPRGHEPMLRAAKRHRRRHLDAAAAIMM